MSNPGNKVPEPKDQLKSCLGMLQHATTDNQKMAALLLFTHLMKTNQSLTVDPKQLFNAIDVKFLVRLLNSSNVPEGCPKHMYKSLALNILSSFTENDVLFHPLLVANLHSIVEVLQMDRTASDMAQMFGDTVDILFIFSTSVDGSEHLSKLKCIPIICKAIIQNPEVDKLLEILQGILIHLPQNSWVENYSDLAEVSIFFSAQFAENQELLKFTICEKLLALLSSFNESQLRTCSSEIFPLKFNADIRKGVNDILQSRCKVEYKYTALRLTEVMIELFGLEWTMINDNDKSVFDMVNVKFLLLTLSIIQTETRIIFESGQIDSKSDIVVSCYAIIEKIIEFLICDNEQGWSFCDEVILKVHASLTIIFDCVIQFLIGISSQEATRQMPCYKQPIIIATIRVLCVWLSEETNALTDKIAQVLPILLKWAKLGQTSADEDNLDTNLPQNEILLHILPPLCHLSADESFCTILVEADCHALLANLFQNLWQTQQVKKADHPSNLITVCNVFLNFSVLEVELVKAQEVFGEVLECILEALPKIVSSNCTTLTAHFVLLGLILFRHRFKLNNPQLTDTQSEFISNSIRFLKQVHTSVSADKSNHMVHWSDISELWFLSVQNLIACGKTIDPVKALILRSSWPKELQDWIKSCKEKKDNLFQDLVLALSPLADLQYTDGPI